ncbi:hypothetical protein LP421_16200 [Rhizobium sp. RCAM05350]|nr:hypothetical protein LP421_16200 [Rhizobium sp. RCAM05350]
MNFEFAGVGDVVFVHVDKLYVVEIRVDFDGEGLPGHHAIAGHGLKLTVRFRGEPEWTFSKIETEALAAATLLLEKSIPVLRDASGTTLAARTLEAEAILAQKKAVGPGYIVELDD